MTDGFLGRWSRRKAAVREGEAVDVEASAPSTQPAPATGIEPARQAPPPLGEEGRGEGPAEARAPTLDDVQALTPESDFKPFMARGVAPEVKNAAVKKLFADPHFNVMDRLDTYIDDYGQPDPIPAALLRQMASARFLKLFDHEDDAVTRDDADTPPAQEVAQSGLVPELPGLPADALTPGATAAPTEDAHTDLRLQPDHAARRESAGPGTS